MEKKETENRIKWRILFRSQLHFLSLYFCFPKSDCSEKRDSKKLRKHLHSYVNMTCDMVIIIQKERKKCAYNLVSSKKKSSLHNRHGTHPISIYNL